MSVTYPKGYKLKRKQVSLYLDEDVIKALNQEFKSTKRPKSHFVNDLLVEYFKLQQRSDKVILED
jgi:hypothetical protein